LNDSELEHPGVVDGRLLEAAEDAAALLEPADQPLDDVAAAVELPVEAGMIVIVCLVALLWNDRQNVAIEEPVVDSLGSIRQVACQCLGRSLTATAWCRNVGGLEHLFQQRRFMLLTRRQFEVQRTP
jgi:hypothetical protein